MLFRSLNDATWAGTIGHNVTSITMGFNPNDLPNTPYSGDWTATLTGINYTNPVDIIVSLAQKLGLKSIQFLSPLSPMYKKIVVFVPTEHCEKVANKMSESGAGKIGNYEECSFRVYGKGTFRGNELSNPSIGAREQKETINQSDIVIISDYNKGFLSKDIIIEISKMGKLVIMDSKKILDYDLIEHINFVKLNEIEYKNNKELVGNYANKFIITLGSNGAKHNNVLYPSKNPQDTIDVSGAGDSFVSAFILKYYFTNNVSDSINFANDVCSDVVSRKGVSLPNEKFKIKL